MPTNVTAEYRRAEARFREARTAEEKVAALEEMLTTVPKHKGTEKLQADIRRRLSKLKHEAEQQQKRRGFSIHVEREGAGQVTVVGPANAGKTRLVTALSGVDLEIADYPFTTRRPQPAMMAWEDVQVQLVDLPPVTPEHTESWIPGLVRNADLGLVVVDLASDEVLEQLQATLELLEQRKVRLVPEKCGRDDHASIATRQALFAATKADLPGAEENREALEELYSDRLGLHVVSAESGLGVEELREALWRALDVVRVYSKPPHHEPDMTRPFVLPAGSTMGQFAAHVHRDFADRLQFARVWGDGKFDGQRVNRDYVLADRDVVELHA